MIYKGENHFYIITTLLIISKSLVGSVCLSFFFYIHAKYKFYTLIINGELHWC